MSITSSPSFKKQLIRAVEMYPQIWDQNYKCNPNVKEQAWQAVHHAMNFPGRHLRKVWSNLARHYLKIIMDKTIQWDNTAPKWKYFHDITFLYEGAKKQIEDRLGGITPPLFLRDPFLSHTPTGVCPCCVNENSGQTLLHSSRPVKTANQTARRRNMAQMASKQNKERLTKDLVLARTQLIDCIKRHPILYVKSMGKSVRFRAAAWNEVATEIGIPLWLAQNRWRKMRARYIDELVRRERNTGQRVLVWENFEQMSFMWPHVQEDLENINKNREEIESIVSQMKDDVAAPSETYVINEADMNDNDEFAMLDCDQSIWDLELSQPPLMESKIESVVLSSDDELSCDLVT